jgi:hypothetical protein
MIHYSHKLVGRWMAGKLHSFEANMDIQSYLKKAGWALCAESKGEQEKLIAEGEEEKLIAEGE